MTMTTNQTPTWKTRKGDTLEIDGQTWTVINRRSTDGTAYLILSRDGAYKTLTVTKAG